jgi:type I restriction enzyme S subunit
MISSTWSRVKLGSLCNIRRGSSPRPIVQYLAGIGMPWVKIADATKSNTRYIFETKEFLKFEGVQSSVLVEPGDLILSNSGTAGLPKFMQIKACIHDGWQVLRDFRNIDKVFLYYELLFLREKLLHGAYDSSMKNLTLEMVREIMIDLPPLKVQIEISALLSLLDEKIELNQSINKNLEDMAQTLYSRWFVDFEFPNENANPYKSSSGEMVESELGLIPKGWKIQPLGNNDLAKLISSGIDEFSNEKTYIATADVENTLINSYSTKVNFTNRPSRANMQPQVNSIWFAKLKNSRKLIRVSEIDEYLTKETIFSTGFAGLSCRNGFSYLWVYLSSRDFDDHKNNFSNGTTMEGINNENINRILILIPPVRLLNQFESVAKSFFDKISLNQKENLRLAKIRDELLPKLMSGEIQLPVKD